MPEVSLVVNFELPNMPEAYVHRIGRTARAGKEGLAISFCTNDELGLLKDIQKVVGQLDQEDRRSPEGRRMAAAAQKQPPKRGGRGGGGGNRNRNQGFGKPKQGGQRPGGQRQGRPQRRQAA